MTLDLHNLTLKPNACARWNYRLRQWIALTLLYVPGAALAAHALQRLSRKLTNIETAHRLIPQMREAAARPAAEPITAFGPHIQSADSLPELPCAEQYRNEIESGTLAQCANESSMLYDTMIPLMSQLIAQEKLTQVINFGVCYAHVDSVLARKHPTTQFIGVGQSPLTKYYNERFFHQPNLSFEAADIAEVLARQKWERTALMHARSVSSLLPAYVEPFYRRAAAAGVEHIVLAELCGISWETGEPYAFSYDPKPSVALRNHIYIHNYPGILRAAGYHVEHAELKKTRHPDPNFRLVIIRARKAY